MGSRGLVFSSCASAASALSNCLSASSLRMSWIVRLSSAGIAEPSGVVGVAAAGGPSPASASATSTRAPPKAVVDCFIEADSETVTESGLTYLIRSSL
jgi:hypothetical protein